MVERFEDWKHEQADVMLSEKIEDLEASGIIVSDTDRECMKDHYDDWVAEQTNEYRDLLESGAFSL